MEEKSTVKIVPPPLHDASAVSDDGEDWIEKADAESTEVERPAVDSETLDQPSDYTSSPQQGKGKIVADEEVEEKEEKTKRHMNLVFVGGVDVGKSTTCGQILILCGQEEAIDVYEENQKLAFIMDVDTEERAKGMTMGVGRAQFETENTRFTILDAPGHKGYVSDMISGASQADVGVLVISARKGEFETAFKRHNTEHLHIVKMLCVSKLVVVVNKMDDPTVGWSKERYEKIKSSMCFLLRMSTYDWKEDVQFLPISGLMGSNIKNKVDKEICSWWNGPCLFEMLDAIEVPLREPNGPLRMSIIDKYKDMETVVVMGKIESGTIREGDNLLIMPNKASVKVLGMHCDENTTRWAGPGENVRVKLSGIEEEDILAGFVLSSVTKPVGAVYEFEAQIKFYGLHDHDILTAGYKAVLHIRSAVEECEIVDLIEHINAVEIESKNIGKRESKMKPLFVKTGASVICRIQVNNLICVDSFTDCGQPVRFILRVEGTTIASGDVLALPPSGSATLT